MPSYKEHLVGGTVSFGAMLLIVSRWYYPTAPTTIEWLFCSLAGSLFPDIDIKSKGQKYFYWCILIALVIISIKKRFDILVGCSVISVMPMLVKHRGIFHRLWFVIGFPLLLWFLISLQFPQLRLMILLDVIFFISGAVSHLWLDMGLARMLRI